MTTEKKAALIRNTIILLLVTGISAIVFAPRNEKTKKQESKTVEQVNQTSDDKDGAGEITNFCKSSQLKEGDIPRILDEAAKKRGGIVVGIIHCHVPGNPESEQMADILNSIARRYGKQVKVIRVDIIAYPEVAKAEMVTKPPKVVMMAGGKRACKFQGLWTQAQIERKVDELLHGLERVGRDWRPEVKGMRPVTESNNEDSVPQ